MTEDEEALRHKKKMQKRKEFQDKKLTEKTIKKGLLLVHTGNGKGKSTAAFGLALRSLGYDRFVTIAQFIKGTWDTGEYRALQKFGELVSWYAPGAGFTWDTQDRSRDIDGCVKAWNFAKEALQNPKISLVILDEINIALRHHYLDVDDVLSVIKARPKGQHVVMTGRHALDRVMDVADLVTEMCNHKHHFQNGVVTQQGIEY